MSAYWNPYYIDPDKYIRRTSEEYNRIWDEAFSYKGKRVRVVRGDGCVITGILSRITTCVDGGLGLDIVAFGICRFVSPEFQSIEIVED